MLMYCNYRASHNGISIVVPIHNYNIVNCIIIIKGFTDCDVLGIIQKIIFTVKFISLLNKKKDYIYHYGHTHTHTNTNIQYIITRSYPHFFHDYCLHS